MANESFVVGEAPNNRGETPDHLDPFTVAFLAACQGLADLNGNEGVSQLVRSIHAEPRQATALLTSMLRLGLPETSSGIVDRLVLEEVKHRTNMELNDQSKRVPTLFDRPDEFVDSGKAMAIHIFADSSFNMSNQFRAGKSDDNSMAAVSMGLLTQHLLLTSPPRLPSM